MNQTVETADLKAWLKESAARLTEHKERLCELDAATGDADHGSNMDRGFSAVLAVLEDAEGETQGELLKRVGLTLVDHIGGSSGALYGTFFLRMSKSVGLAPGLDGASWVRAWRAAADGVSERGGVVVGDKTLYDALAPAVDALEAAVTDGVPLSDALTAAAWAAKAGADGTAELVARRGRASYLGERSLGHPDAGAHSMALVVQAAATSVT
jgi:phosphoenolpyruvate---glycerone phosphotransferase subunit DhaL